MSTFLKKIQEQKRIQEEMEQQTRCEKCDRCYNILTTRGAFIHAYANGLEELKQNIANHVKNNPFVKSCIGVCELCFEEDQDLDVAQKVITMNSKFKEKTQNILEEKRKTYGGD